MKSRPRIAHSPPKSATTTDCGNTLWPTLRLTSISPKTNQFTAICQHKGLFDFTKRNMPIRTQRHFWSKGDIWNVNCASNSIHFQHTNRCSCEKVKDFETENVSTWGGLEPPTFGFIPNALLTYWAIRARHLLPHVLNTGSGSIDIFEVKITFEMLTVHGQQHSFLAHERVFLWKCQSFETENVSTWGGLEPPTFGFMPNALTYWTQRTLWFF